MKYFGEPGLSVIDYDNLKTMFKFNEKGEYETDDPKLVAWMKKNKNFIRCEENKLPADGLYNCKKCEYATTNKGELMAHYRTEHPKGG
jgi:hypothetical protein